MKKTILTIIVLLSVLFVSCYSNKDNYTYKWKVAITYTNGDLDTINCQYNSFNGNKCYLTLKTSEPGVLSNAPMVPCIVMGCGFRQEVVTCDVRKYEIIESDMIKI